MLIIQEQGAIHHRNKKLACMLISVGCKVSVTIKATVASMQDVQDLHHVVLFQDSSYNLTMYGAKIVLCMATAM